MVAGNNNSIGNTPLETWYHHPHVSLDMYVSKALAQRGKCPLPVRSYSLAKFFRETAKKRYLGRDFSIVPSVQRRFIGFTSRVARVKLSTIL